MTNLRFRVVGSVYGVGHNGVNRAPIDHSQTIEYAFGEGMNSATNGWTASAALPTSSTTTYLFDGTPNDAFGGGIDLASIKTIHIINTGTTSLTLGGTCRGVAAITLPPGGQYLVTSPAATGFTLTAGTSAGSITITNVSASVIGAYTIAILGVDL